MSSKYLSTPDNISRFIEMSSRSLSPQREISQMTAQLHRSYKKVGGIRDTDNSHEKSTREYENTNNNTNSHIISNISPSVEPHVVVEEEENSIENTAYLLQCGSPLYDPVKEGWRCWNGHELRVKERNQYINVEGVSCDFCGYTDWLEELQETTTTTRATTEVRGKRRGGGKIKQQQKLVVTAISSSSSSSEKEKELLLTKQSPKCFYHCDVCGMDLCTYCAAELRADRRYHVPCLQCRRCHVFLRPTPAALHRCAPKRTRETPATATATSTSGGGASSSSSSSSSSSHTDSNNNNNNNNITTLGGFKARRESSPIIVPLVTNTVAAAPSLGTTTTTTTSSTTTTTTAWEVCVTFETAAAEAEVRVIGESLGFEEVGMPEAKGQLIFRTRTRLAAEEFAQRIHDIGLFTSLRRFRV